MRGGHRLTLSGEAANEAQKRIFRLQILARLHAEAARDAEGVEAETFLRKAAEYERRATEVRHG